MENTLSYAKSQDQQDSLRKFRDQYSFPVGKNEKSPIYLCGNSLGLQPKQTEEYIRRELEDWRNLGVEGHFHSRNPWFQYHWFLKKGLAECVGAKEIEVSAMNSLTVNLHLMMVSFYRPTKERYKILTLKNAFPSDQYAFKSQLRFHGLTEKDALIQVGPKTTEGLLDEEELYRTIRLEGDKIALILFEGVSYLTGQAFDLEKIVKEGHAKGCVVGFDLAHAIGNIPMKLHDWDADFAVWCSYKYLNSGPGAVGGCFVHERFSGDKNIPRFEGWWGHSEEKRLLMESEFIPMPGIDAWQLSNVPILSSAALMASLDLFVEAGMENLRKKSVKLTGYLEFLLKEHCKHKIHIITPELYNQRGSQLSIAFQNEGKKFHEKLVGKGVICDWREPNVIRVAPTAMYNSFEDVYRFVEILNQL